MNSHLLTCKSNKAHSAFTLIELLVVISIIAMLLAILMPALGIVKEKAKSTVCKAHLHQWGLAMATYTSEYNGRFMGGHEADIQTGRQTWIHALRPYYSDNDSIRFCPSARKTLAEGGRQPLAAWDLATHDLGKAGNWTEIINDRGSYGINWWLNDNDASSSLYSNANKWRTSSVGRQSEIPVMFDCGFFLSRPLESDNPPATGGKDGVGWDPINYNMYRGMTRICHDRHNVAINIVFMDSSARTVKCRELWDLKWHRNWKVTREIDWPDWVR